MAYCVAGWDLKNGKWHSLSLLYWLMDTELISLSFWTTYKYHSAWCPQNVSWIVHGANSRTNRHTYSQYSRTCLCRQKRQCRGRSGHQEPLGFCSDYELKDRFIPLSLSLSTSSTLERNHTIKLVLRFFSLRTLKDSGTLEIIYKQNLLPVCCWEFSLRTCCKSHTPPHNS